MVGPYTPIGELLGHLHLSAHPTPSWPCVIAEVYESAPYYVLGAQAAFTSVDPRLEQQAQLLGDRPARVFRRVTLPLATPGLAMALSVAWARAMGAFGAVIIIAYHPFGIPLQIYTTLQETGLASALPFALVLLVVALPAAAGRLHLERPCWTPTSRLTAATSPCAPPCASRPGSGWPCSARPGAGKTTLLEVIAGPRRPAPRSGRARRAGADVHRRRHGPRCRRGSAGSGCCARIPACSRTCPYAPTWPTAAPPGPPAGAGPSRMT